MSRPATPENLFTLLPKTRTSWREFAFSIGTQSFAIGFLVFMHLLYPSVMSHTEHRLRPVFLLSTPVPLNHQPQILRKPSKPPKAAQAVAPAEALRLPRPQPKTAERTTDLPAPVVNIASRELDPLPINSRPLIPKPAVSTNLFSSGSSATPTTFRSPSEVQAGGFGDANGVPAKTGQRKAVNVAAKGSFDLPSGPGSDNGTASGNARLGVVASSGFGNVLAKGISQARLSANAIQASGFGSLEVPASPATRSHSTESSSRSTPAEILFKPVPLYTQEAKNLRIEGEVLMEVVLEATGSLRVVRIVRGLGHGLDDNALRAAKQIHFKPAVKDGQPADSTVVLHIIFQLA
ncbi:MAG TPA: energy transducer TonB [Candidatus Acidoferrum sp.]|nr:energy transducer TonB [Candidatus Acidoferrum sp.]